jgi:heptosyltransferase-1
MEIGGIPRPFSDASNQSRSQIDLSGSKRLLIVKMSSIGDVVLASPVASALRRTYPSLRISWAVEEHTMPLVSANPCVDRVVMFPRMTKVARRRGALRDTIAAVRALRAEPYDIVLDLQGLLRTAVVSLLSGAPIRIGLPRRREGAHLLLRAIPIPKGCHVVEEYMACARFLGAKESPVAFHVPRSIRAADSVEEMLKLAGVPSSPPLVVLNPSTSADWRIWPVENWRVVAARLAIDAPVVLVGSQSQRVRHARVAAGLNDRIFDLTGRTTLLELIALLDRCSLHIAGDTGSAHIAAALGRPVVGIYGPTNPQRVGPYGQRDRVAYQAGLCGSTCPDWCLRNRRCLRTITSTEVISKAQAAIAQSAKPVFGATDASAS